uniref:Uncharacterized protein n=1 Tax=Leersia perrieri TaxID=77586 RepID=A0A0D9WI89_9ORYZ
MPPCELAETDRRMLSSRFCAVKMRRRRRPTSSALPRLDMPVRSRQRRRHRSASACPWCGDAAGSSTPVTLIHQAFRFADWEVTIVRSRGGPDHFTHHCGWRVLTSWGQSPDQVATQKLSFLPVVPVGAFYMDLREMIKRKSISVIAVRTVDDH